jgi:HlyD family secretion protein
MSSTEQYDESNKHNKSDGREPSKLNADKRRRIHWTALAVAAAVLTWGTLFVASHAVPVGLSDFPPCPLQTGLKTNDLPPCVLRAISAVQQPQPEVVPARQLSVSALARLEPQSEVVKLSVPAFLRDERVGQVLVKEGDWLAAGQAVCVLDAESRLRTNLQEASAQLAVSQARLRKIQAGAKQGEIDAQKSQVDALCFELQQKLREQDALIERCRAELTFNQSESERYGNLYVQGAISTSQRDSKTMAFNTSKARLQEALAEQQRLRETLTARIHSSLSTLEQIAEVRPVDVDVARAEVAEAQARVQKIAADLALTTIRSARAGRVLKMHVRPGEVVTTDKGVADVGGTDTMVAVAEVYQSDINKVRVGQRATINSDAIAEPLHGKVYRVGWQIVRQNVYAQEPTAASDRRVVEVKVLLDPADSKKAQALTYMQVNVAIQTPENQTISK